MIHIDAMHNGPPNSGHGGVSAGRMAQALGLDRAAVRFEAPIPLARPLNFGPIETVDAAPASSGQSDGAGVAGVFDGSTRVATVSAVAPIETGSFRRLDPMAVAVAESAWFDNRAAHPVPGCFSCGPARADDGLGLRPGPVPGSADYAAFWTPTGAGHVPTWLVWAAMDCPTGLPTVDDLDPDQVPVTGWLAVDIRQPVIAGHQYQIISRVVSRSGRKFTTEAGLVNRFDETVAVASAVWLAVPRSSMMADPQADQVLVAA
jgi:hypothetical protein